MRTTAPATTGIPETYRHLDLNQLRAFARREADRTIAIYQFSPLHNSLIINLGSSHATETTLDAMCAAKAHPIRRAILTKLTTRTATVNEPAAPLQMSQPAISKHLKVL